MRTTEEPKSKLSLIEKWFRGDKNSGLPRPLIQALELCGQALKVRDERVKYLMEFRDELIREDRGDEVEKVDYDIDLVNWQLTDAYEEGKRRLEYIKSLDTPGKRQAELIRCSEDTIHWINHWAWVHEPRTGTIVHALPFKLFPFQVEYIKWLEDLCFKYQRPGLTDKSRDMGATWQILAFITKQWRFRNRFDVLVGSKVEDFVDKKGRDDTLLEKIRFLIRRMPIWMLPDGFDLEKHMPYMNILNPETGSYVAGESSNPNFGRQGRYSLAFIDEFPIFPEGGYEAWTSVSQSAFCILVVGTPKGKFNKFADLRLKSRIRVKTLHWKDHPRKDERWYKALSATMTDAEKGQELDCDYETSQAGLVLPQFNPLYSVITWSEFAEGFVRANPTLEDKMYDSDGHPRIPKDWLLGCAQDVGYSEDHRCVTTWAATPAARYPFSDCVFLYRQYMAPLDLAPEQIGEKIIELEARYEEAKRMYMRLNSHEGKSERLTYANQDLDFEAWETDFCAGIAQLRNYMVVRGQDPNPFRPQLFPYMKGRSRFYVIVDDRQGLPKWDDSSKKWLITDAINDAGFLRARIEIQMYHIPESEAGKPAKQQRPMKAVDDAMDTWRALAAQFFPPIAPLDPSEMVDRALPPNLQMKAAQGMSKEDFSMFWITRQLAAAEIEIPEDKHWRQKLFKSRFNRHG